MGLSGRKTGRLGPVRLTASKSGLTPSIGGKRARVSVNAKGRGRASINLGKGFRWTR